MSINIILYEAKEQPLKERFALLTAKFLYKSFAQKFSLVVSSIHDMEIAANTHSKRVTALGSSPSFRQYILHRSNFQSIYTSSFPPAFYYDYYSTTFTADYRFDLSSILKEAPQLQVIAEFNERTRKVTGSSFVFYTDGSKRPCQSQHLFPRSRIQKVLQAAIGTFGLFCGGVGCLGNGLSY